MRKYSTAIALFTILTWSSTASAYSRIFYIFFENQRGHSVVVSTSPGNEASTYDQLKTRARIFEVDVFVRLDDCTSVVRVGQQSVSCVSDAIDYSLSVGCTYCNASGSFFLGTSWIIGKKNGANVDEVGTGQSPQYVRCEIPPEPD